MVALALVCREKCKGMSTVDSRFPFNSLSKDGVARASSKSDATSYELGETPNPPAAEADPAISYMRKRVASPLEKITTKVKSRIVGGLVVAVTLIQARRAWSWLGRRAKCSRLRTSNSWNRLPREWLLYPTIHMVSTNMIVCVYSWRHLFYR